MPFQKVIIQIDKNMYIQHSVSSVLFGQSGLPLQKSLLGLHTSAVPGQSWVPEKHA